MLDKIRDFFDRIPRPGELDTRGRAVAGASAAVIVAVILMLILWADGAFGSSATTSQAEGDGLPYGGGVVKCDRWPDNPTEEEVALGQAAGGGERGLPYRTNIGDTVIRGDNLRFAVISICMEPDATQEQITDTATVIARNIKADFPGQAGLAGVIVAYMGTGHAWIHTVDTIDYWSNYTFSRDEPIEAQRSAWEWTENPDEE